MFESFDQEVKGNPIDSFVFWYAQIGACIFWALVLAIKVLTFSLFWVILCGVCFSLGATNLYAYYLCRRDYHAKLKNLVGGTMQSFLVSQVKSRFGL